MYAAALRQGAQNMQQCRETPKACKGNLRLGCTAWQQPEQIQRFPCKRTLQAGCAAHEACSQAQYIIQEACFETGETAHA